MYCGSKSVGGVLGWVNGVTSSILECTNDGKISSTGGFSGGIVGQIRAKNVDGCRNIGNVWSEGSGCGGIIGAVVNNYTMESVTNCTNVGEISGKQAIGGIVGGTNGGSSLIAAMKNCTNTGNITGNLTVGGICGQISLLPSGTGMQNCSNAGMLSSMGRDTGGIAGNGNGLIEKCYNQGDMKIFTDYGVGRHCWFCVYQHFNGKKLL